MAKKKKRKQDEDVRRAWSAVSHHCAFNDDIESVKEDMWEMLKASLTHGEDFFSAKDRSNFIYTYETLIELLDAMHILHLHKTGKMKLQQ
jgi:hypothetical protein